MNEKPPAPAGAQADSPAGQGVPPTMEAVAMDPAHKSLADALKLSFLILQIVMALLVLGYLGTGLRSVSEQERGLRLLFGVIRDAEPLQPGPHMSWPYPIGEFIKVMHAEQSLNLNEQFWLGLNAGEETQPFERLNRSINQGLVPNVDGSIVTADGNVAHTRWTIQWRIRDPRLFQSNIIDSQAEQIVTQAVERGVVMAASEMQLDQIIQSPGDLGSRVKSYAQEILDRIDSGIELERANCTEARPPRAVLDDYEAVNQERSKAEENIEAARDEATQILNRTAGRAHKKLLDLIGQYELLADSGKVNSDEAQAVLHRIDALLISDEVGGEVARTLNDARIYQASVVTEFKTQADRFSAWYPKYQQNPDLILSSLWARSLKKIFSRDVEVFSVSDDTEMIEIRINRDPSIKRRRQIEAAEAEQEANLAAGGG